MISSGNPVSLKYRLQWPVILLVLLSFNGCSSETADQGQSDRVQTSPVDTSAEFAPGMPWLNVERPLTFDDMLGKVVILDFWTYGCINCIHVLADLKKLEEKYGDQLLVIGVHTPKFDNEKNLDTLRSIVIRYGVDHPVVNDVDSLLAGYYGMRAWPTRVFIDPAGEVLGRVTGEGKYLPIDNKITELLEQHKSILNLTPIPLRLERENSKPTPLAAPGKLAVSDTHLAISDSLHNRILVTDHQGQTQHIIGTEEAGNEDGGFNRARFNMPQGLVFDSNGIYVADTGNHTIRYIDLIDKTVTTVAGNGALERKREGYYKATSIGMASPWALALRDDRLFIAMAGSHQIWVYNTASKQLIHFAGSGREGIADGDIEKATFSQPSGLSLFGDWLYIADSEASAIRRIHLKDEVVETLVGKGLFDFGDVDGKLHEAKLQHVLGIAVASEHSVILADTYNHKIKIVDLGKDVIKSIIGDGRPGFLSTVNGQFQLNEPGGLALHDKTLFIADTNNNRIVVHEIGGKSVSVLEIKKQ
ncbi:MAG: thioredoxin-like domain-containing protein [Candidatus Thiodiazotropha endolucinida]